MGGKTKILLLASSATKRFPSSPNANPFGLDIPTTETVGTLEKKLAWPYTALASGPNKFATVAGKYSFKKKKNKKNKKNKNEYPCENGLGEKLPLDCSPYPLQKPPVRKRVPPQVY